MEKAARMLHLAVLVSILGRVVSEVPGIDELCPHESPLHNPYCQNGGHLHAHAKYDYSSCSHCDCPEGWTGPDCSLCTSSSSCQDKRFESGAVVVASGCTHASIQPQKGDLRKRMGCFCGGMPGDVFSSYVCDTAQPFSHWMVDLIADVNSTDLADGSPFHATLYERAGTPPSTADPERMKYAYPGVLEGNLTGCTWEMNQPCTAPMTGSDCYAVTCDSIDYSCPPAGQETCPGFTGTSCGKVPGSSKPYWMHKCNPLALPTKDRVTLLTCNATAATDGSFQCYFSQVGALVGAIGMQCKVGDCQYEPPPPPGPAPTPEPGPGPSPGPEPSPPVPPKPPINRINHPEAYALGAVALILLSFIVVVGFFVRFDRRRAAGCEGLFKEDDDDELAIVESEREHELAPLFRGGGSAVMQPLMTPSYANGRGTQSHHNHRPSTVAFSFVDIQYTVMVSPSMRQRVVLHSITGLNFPVACESPESVPMSSKAMLSILGPSGAGKSSLLDILSGRKCGRAVSGQLRVDGKPITAQDMRRISGYVHQDDVLPGTATVWEYMLFHASLRGSPGSSSPRAIENQLAQLGLSKVAHSLIGDMFCRGISGGEKRRLSVAIELLTTPALLFLDEPTTGLDSTSAAQVVDILASLGHRGVNVMLSIHQPRPDVLRLMDSLLVLSPNGHLVYTGPTARLDAHLASLSIHPPSGTLNVADYLLDYVISAGPRRLAHMVNRYKQSDVCISLRQRMEQMAVESAALSSGRMRSMQLPTGAKRQPFRVQLWMLSAVLFRRMYRHPFLIATGFVATLIAAVSLAVTFQDTGYDTQGIQNRFGMLFFMMLFLSLMSLSSLPIWAEDMLLFFRERDSGAYSTSPYFLARVLFDVLPLRAFPPLLFTLITYPAAGLHSNSGACVAWFTVTLVAGNTAAALLCMCLGALLPSLTLANMVGSVAIMLSLLLCGYMLNGSTAPRTIAMLHRISFFSEAYENLVITEFHDNPTPFYFTAPVDSLPQLRVTGDGVLKQFGYQSSRFGTNLALLGAYSVICLLVTYACLLLSHPAVRDVLVQVLQGPMMDSTQQDDEHLDEQGLLRDGDIESSGELRDVSEAATASNNSSMRHNVPVSLPGDGASDIEGMDAAQSFHYRRVTESARASQQDKRSATSATTSPHRRHASESVHSMISGDGGLEMTHSRTSSLSTTGPGHGGGAHRTSLSVDLHDVAEHAEQGSKARQQDSGPTELQNCSSSGSEHKEGSVSDGGASSRSMKSVGAPSVSLKMSPLSRHTDSVLGDAAAQNGKAVTWGASSRINTDYAAVEVPTPRPSNAHRDAAPGMDRLPLAWHALNISVAMPNGDWRRIVEHVSGTTESSNIAAAATSSVLAILGPSGAGKSTLLDVLAGRVNGRKVRGSITVCGHPTTPAMRRRLCGYVLQDDIMPETSTVREYLMFHAQLRMGESVTAEQCSERVDDVIALLNLRSCADSRIGGGLQRGISGGENRRARIAAELLTYPRLLLVDEATTGLDSTSAAAVVAILSRLSADGVTVALSIHQPRSDIFAMLSHILLLSSEGRMVFSGPAASAQSHFAALGHVPPPDVNIADFLLDVTIRSSLQEQEELVHAFATSPANQAFASQSSALSFAAALAPGGRLLNRSSSVGDMLLSLAKYTPPFNLQAKLLARRKLHSLLRHPWLLAFALCATIATALLMSTVYSHMDRATPGIQNRFAGFFFVILYLSLVSLSSIPVWQTERGLFLRERAAGLYNTPAYVATAVAADLLVMRMIPPLILGLLAYPLMGLRGGAGHQTVFCITLMLCNLAAAAMNMAIGAACSSTSLANMLGSIAVMANVLFGGFLMSLHDLPHLINGLAQISFARYAFNILAVNEFKGADDFMLTPFTPPGVDPKTLPHKDVTGDDILSIFFFRTNTMANDMFALVALTVFYVGLTALLLHTQR